ncbi:MAG: ribonuclease HI [Leptolyngbyaceae bacterium]|nr:ribonuclease HI [Leptolyngbyaceae bacterium]
MALQQHIERIYPDGACSGNPGPGGWAVVAYIDDGSVHELGGREAKTTNNRMELQGAIAALQLLTDNQQTTPVTLYTDSQYVKNGITKWISGWKKKDWKTATGKPVVNIDLWEQLDALHHQVKRQLSLTWEYVRGHAGDEGNERCDAIARAFSKNSYPALHQVSAFTTPGRAKSQFTVAETTDPGDRTSEGAIAAPSKLSSVSTKTTASSSTSSDPVMAASHSSSSSDAQPSDMTPSAETPGAKLQALRALVDTLQLADTLAEQRYLLTTSELADLVGNTVSTVTNRGDSWVWRNWLIRRVRQEGNQILWQLERIS